MQQHELDQLKQDLLQEKERLEAEVRSYKSEDPFLAEDRDMEIHSIDNDSTDNEAHDRIEGVRESLKEDLSRVLLAIRKIDDGKYGLCEKCDQEIELDRLQANPTAQFCLTHAR